MMSTSANAYNTMFFNICSAANSPLPRMKQKKETLYNAVFLNNIAKFVKKYIYRRNGRKPD